MIRGHMLGAGAGLRRFVPPRGEIGPAIGFILATVGLVVGIGTLYKSWK